jgi:hypothetical protein
MAVSKADGVRHASRLPGAPTEQPVQPAVTGKRTSEAKMPRVVQAVPPEAPAFLMSAPGRVDAASEETHKALGLVRHRAPAASTKPTLASSPSNARFHPMGKRVEWKQASVGVDCTKLYKPGDGLPLVYRNRSTHWLSRELIGLQITVNSAFLENPSHFVRSYGSMAAAAAKPGQPVTFSPDEAKAALVPEQWLGKGPGDPEALKFRASGANVALHQAAHACAQLAFVERLDELAKLPADDPKRSILITNGGCGSGKGYALKKGLDGEFKNRFGAVWDAAGEQCALDNHWILDECAKRGIRATLVYVHADPETAFKRAITTRFAEEGRLVNTRSFAESYADGAENMRRIVGTLRNHPAHTDLVFIDNTGEKPRAKVFLDHELDAAQVTALELIPAFNDIEALKRRLDAAVPPEFPDHGRRGLFILR